MKPLKTKKEKELEELKKAIVPILKKNGVVRAGIFGSFARGEAKKGSDVDILIKFDRKAKKSLLDVIGLEQDIEKKAGRKVDLVEYDVIHPRLKDQILHDEVRIL